jgi:hypothetical protein
LPAGSAGAAPEARARHRHPLTLDSQRQDLQRLKNPQLIVARIINRNLHLAEFFGQPERG